MLVRLAAARALPLAWVMPMQLALVMLLLLVWVTPLSLAWAAMLFQQTAVWLLGSRLALGLPAQGAAPLQMAWAMPVLAWVMLLLLV
jgi:hypothetical protein